MLNMYVYILLYLLILCKSVSPWVNIILHLFSVDISHCWYTGFSSFLWTKLMEHHQLIYLHIHIDCSFKKCFMKISNIQSVITFLFFPRKFSHFCLNFFAPLNCPVPVFLLITVNACLDYVSFNASSLHRAISGIGTDDDSLIRVVVSRCEVSWTIWSSLIQPILVTSIPQAVSMENPVTGLFSLLWST